MSNTAESAPTSYGIQPFTGITLSQVTRTAIKIGGTATLGVVAAIGLIVVVATWVGGIAEELEGDH